KNLDTFEVFDVRGRSWSALPPLPTARSGLGAAALAGRIYVAGGESLTGDGRTFSELEVFDPASGRWQSAPPLPTARHGIGMVAHDGQVYVLQGGRRAGLSVTNLNEQYRP
ncbi:MAG TPA: kelch repeat-containing protein, partial [Herpetosiphonaceae bacterium]|nr:kelch repeat-containing protein [Herpetosiphonaceae bacterium]